METRIKINTKISKIISMEKSTSINTKANMEKRIKISTTMKKVMRNKTKKR